MLWPNAEGQSPGNIKIGDPFPKSDLVSGGSPSAWTMLSGPGLLFLIIMPDVTGEDFQGFNESIIKFAVAWDRGVVHLLMSFSEWVVAEAPMDPYCHTEAEREQFISAGGMKQNIPVVLIESGDDIVRGIRILLFRRKIMDKIRHLYNVSGTEHLSQRSVRRALELTKKVSHPEPGDLFNDRAVMCQQFS